MSTINHLFPFYFCLFTFQTPHFCTTSGQRNRHKFFIMVPLTGLHLVPGIFLWCVFGCNTAVHKFRFQKVSVRSQQYLRKSKIKSQRSKAIPYQPFTINHLPLTIHDQFQNILSHDGTPKMAVKWLNSRQLRAVAKCPTNRAS
jgi:hypothetical protein